MSCHFNGWWYAAIPAQCFRDFGLPSPIFIRGDDLEFGTRLHRAGIETVSLPPVSVWHEPFYAKPPGWQLYYDFRNRLIFASLYEGFALDAPSRLLKLLMVHLIRYDYQQAWFMITALEDFLKGPELLKEGLPAIHERMTQGARPYAPGKLMSAPGLQPAPAELPTRPGAIRQRMLTSLARVFIGRPRGGAYGLHYTDAPLQSCPRAAAAQGRTAEGGGRPPRPHRPQRLGQEHPAHAGRHLPAQRRPSGDPRPGGQHH